MQFETKKTDFSKGLQIVQNAISQKNTLPILSNLLMEIDEKDIKLTATDLDIGISARVKTDTKQSGAITIPAKRIFDIIKELPEESIVKIFLKKNNMISIDCEKSHFKMIGMPKEEFPKIPDFKGEEPLVISQKSLKEMIALTSFAVSRDETRYVLNGILFIIEKGKISIVATDGRRLAIVTRKIEKGASFDKKVIVPTKTIQELSKVLNEKGEIKIIFGENQVFFDIGRTNVISRLIEGDFPNYEQVIPKEKKEKVIIDRRKFLSAIKRASLFTNPDSLAVKLDILRNKMIVSKNAPYIGEVKEEISTKYEGKNISIGFNPAYIIDVLKNLKDKEIEFEVEDEDKPGVIRKGSDYIYIVLPMQLT